MQLIIVFIAVERLFVLIAHQQEARFEVHAKVPPEWIFVVSHIFFHHLADTHAVHLFLADGVDGHPVEEGRQFASVHPKLE